MYIPAANIVVSYDPEAMIAFQNTKDFGSFKKFIDSQSDGKKRETMIFSNAPNSNFLDLVHSFGGGDSDNQMKLKIMDPQGVFESEMLDNSLGMQLDIKSDPFLQRLEALESEKFLADNELAQLKKDQENAQRKNYIGPKKNLEDLKQERTKLEDKLDAIETEIANTSVLDDDDKNQSIKDQLKAYTGKMQRQVYITYGIGSNLQDWAPVQCFGKILRIDYGFTGDGVRTLTMHFTGKSIHPNLTQLGVSPLGINFNKGLLCKGVSKFRLFSEEGFKKEADEFVKTYQIQASERSEVEEGLSFDGDGNSFKPSLHWAVVGAIENFIRSATNKSENVLVFMPDLDFYLQGYYAEMQDSVYASVGEVLTLGMTDFGAPNPGSWKDLADDVLGYSKCLEGIGLGMCEVDTGSDSNFTGAIGENVFEYIEECGSADKVTDWFAKNHYRAVLQTEIPKKTFLQTLSEVGKAIANKMAEYAPDDKAIPTQFMNQVNVITDFNLIQILFEKGLITNNRQPVLLWGERNIVDQVLYGRVYETTAKARAKAQDADAEEQTIKDASFADTGDLLAYVDEKLTDYVHRLDQLRGLNSEFAKDVFDYFVPTSWIGPFGKQYNGSNELDATFPADTNLQNASKDAKKANPLLASRMPLFSFGNKNPNILSVNFNLDNQYIAAMNSSSPIGRQAFGGVAGMIPAGFEAEAARIFKGIATLDLTDVDPETKVPRGFEKLMENYYDHDYLSGDDIQNFEQWQEVFDQLDSDKYQNMSDKSFSSDWFGGLDGKQKFMKFMWEAFSQLYKASKPTMEQVTPSKNPSKAAIANSVRVTQNINQMALNGNISTLPMFALSTDRRVLNKACVVHCVEPRITIPNNPQESYKGNTTWFSGIYNMIGFKHSISAQSAKSTFYLSRPGNKGLAKPNEDD